MRNVIENKEFQINVTYTAKEINEIVAWYIETEMPPIYKNYNFEDDEVADMIEDLAIKTLLDVGSNQLINDFLNELILNFTASEEE
jgi:hypothetical protein